MEFTDKLFNLVEINNNALRVKFITFITTASYFFFFAFKFI